jgi:diguanylate cyclase (GGDEF)-like protein
MIGHMSHGLLVRAATPSRRHFPRRLGGWSSLLARWAGAGAVGVPGPSVVVDSDQLDEPEAGSRPSVAEQRDQAGEQRDHAAEQRDEAGHRRDHAAVQRDQAGDRRDHAGKRRDQAGADRDQAGDTRDRVADQRDRASDARDEVADRREQAADDRDHAGDERDHAGDARDQAGDERDLTAQRRDQLAEQRDATAERSELRAGGGVAGDAFSRSTRARREAAADRRRASQDRRAGAGERSQAKLDRNTALADRGAGAEERTQAELDRNTALADRGAGASERSSAEIDRGYALADRGASAEDRASAFVDHLTGVYLRGAGFVELEREIARTRRSVEPLVLGFVDVDHLKAINDSIGHAAGDRLLLDVANSFRDKLRSHDLIIRYGGDEFLCAFSGLDMVQATKRVAFVTAALAAAPAHGSVSVGLAQLREDDSLEDLVARADAALYTERRRGVASARASTGRRSAGPDRNQAADRRAPS